MPDELVVNSSDFDSSRIGKVEAYQTGNSTFVRHTKTFEGEATLADGTYVAFTFSVSKSNAEPVADIVDPLGDYTIKIVKN